MEDNKELKVSVEMITFKHELYIQQAIEGVLMQETNFDFELVIADDCSPDSTPEIVEAIIKNHPKGDKIKYFRHKENIGMQPNGMFAYNQCHGKYVALCEGDDYWTDPLKLQKQVDFLENNSEYVLCFHEVNILKANGEIVSDFITEVPEDYETLERLAQFGNYIHTPSVVFRNIIKEFPFEFELSPIGDFFLYLMLAEHGKLKFLKEKMAVYRFGVGVFSSTSNIQTSKSTHTLFVCLLSYLKDEKIKKIIFARQKNDLNWIENLIRNQYDDVFVSDNLFFTTINFFLKNYTNPRKIIRKVKSKFAKNITT